MLGGLFPSAPKRAAAEAFDPNDDLSAFAKAKKKKFCSKPSNITVVDLSIIYQEEKDGINLRLHVE